MRCDGHDDRLGRRDRYATSQYSHSVAGSRFIDRLALTQIDRDIFTGLCHSGAPLRAYGGQIAAQALRAAGLTVPEDRRVHSLHGYFLRPGQTKDTITYLVEHPRDGGSFSTRIVRAVQHGETIFMMTTSFAAEDEGPTHQFTMPDAPGPDEIPSTPIVIDELAEAASARPGSMDYPERSLIDLRTLDADKRLELIDGRYERIAWVRVTESMGDDDLANRCALAYLSDLTMVTTTLSPHGRGLPLHIASIDHAMWFHAPARADEWLLFAQDTPVARGGHGVARGLFYDTNGTLVASCVQESLMRVPRARG